MPGSGKPLLGQFERRPQSVLFVSKGCLSEVDYLNACQEEHMSDVSFDKSKGASLNEYFDENSEGSQLSNDCFNENSVSSQFKDGGFGIPVAKDGGLGTPIMKLDSGLATPIEGLSREGDASTSTNSTMISVREKSTPVDENDLIKSSNVLMMNGQNEFVNSDNENVYSDYEVIVACKCLKGGVGNVLIDTGAQISLANQGSLNHNAFKKMRRCNQKVQGITGSYIKVSGFIDLSLNEGETHEFQVIETLPLNYDLVIGQDWLKRFGVQFSIPTLGVTIPARSEKIVKFPTNETGTRLIESQELEPNIFCASSITQCKDNTFVCLLVNTSDREVEIKHLPKLEPCPKLQICVTENKNDIDKRIQVLQQNLRLSHVKEGELELRQICSEYNDVFKLPGDKLSSTSAIEHHIPTPSISKERPITLRNYRLPEQHREEVERQVEQMLKDEVITPSQSPWNFPILVVPKKLDASGKRKWRICVDFRKLNDVTVGDSFPLPNIQDILDRLGRARYFSALDCASGYYQVPIATDDRSKTAFSTPTGHYEYLRMPFGLKSAPSTFQRLMNRVLMGQLQNHCFVYLDDVILFGETLQEHNERLREILERLRKHNLKIEPDKCEFLKTELQYLGHVVTTQGVKPDPLKVEAITKFPHPKSPTDVKSFLGLVGYYRKFIPKFSGIAKPLNELLKKDVPFHWSENQEKAFNELKEILISEPLLQYPDFTKSFVLTTDASGFAVGAILSQGPINHDKPIAYASRTLNSAEQNYSVIEKELTAIVWACKHFRPYLLGRPFIIVTDHKPLVWMFNIKEPSSRLLRWRLLLEEFEFNIEHKAGKRNTNADALSRNPVVLTTLIASKEKQSRIIKEMHEFPLGGHLGINRTYDRLKLYVTWPGMYQDVERFIKCCKICQENKIQGPYNKAPLQETDTQNEVWDKIYLDIVGPYPISEDGHKYVLTCQDNLSKYIIGIPMFNQTAEEVALHFLNSIILVYGIPQQIVTDQGTQFLSELFQRLCKLLRITKLNTTAYHPESNGALERTHRALTEYLRCFCAGDKSDWNKWIPFACFTYNTTPHSMTKYTPYELMYGKKPNLPGLLQQKITPTYNYDDMVHDIKRKLQECREKARLNLIETKQKRVKDTGDRKMPSYKVGEQVWLKNENPKKLDALWLGPYTIQSIDDKGLNIVIKGKSRKPFKVHVNRLKSYVSSLAGDKRKGEQ